jgi:hypothetical protein
MHEHTHDRSDGQRHGHGHHDAPGRAHGHGHHRADHGQRGLTGQEVGLTGANAPAAGHVAGDEICPKRGGNGPCPGECRTCPNLGR